MTSMRRRWGSSLIVVGTCLQLWSCGNSFTGAAAGGAGAGAVSGGVAQTGDAGTRAGTPAAGGDAGATTSEAGSGDAAAGVAGVASAAYPALILAAGPIAYWRMGAVENGSVHDETGGGNDLVLQGGGHLLHAPGAVRDDPDGAIGFDGEKSFAIASDPRALDFLQGAPFTVECWARRNIGGASYYQYLVANIQGVAGNRDGYALYLLPAPGGPDSAVSAFEYDRPKADFGIHGPLPLASVWGHYAAVFDGTAVALYIDGTLARSAPVAGNIGLRSAPFAVGRHSESSGTYFKGELDELAVYAHALKTSEIVKHVNAAASSD